MAKKGDIIKNLRLQKNISQIELAEKIGVSKQTMYKYENNIISNIPSDKIELMAKALNTSPSEIMGWHLDDKETDALQENTLFSLKDNEIILLNIYRNLNKEGKEKAMERLQEMSQLDQYKKGADSKQSVG